MISTTGQGKTHEGLYLYPSSLISLGLYLKDAIIMNYTTFTPGTASVIMSLYPGKIIVIKYDKVKPNQSKEIKES